MTQTDTYTELDLPIYTGPEVDPASAEERAEIIRPAAIECRGRGSEELLLGSYTLPLMPWYNIFM